MSARVVDLRPARPSRQQPVVAFGKTVPGTRGLFRTLLDRLIAVDMRHRQRADLAALDDYLLKDIGVSRAEVDRALRGL